MANRQTSEDAAAMIARLSGAPGGTPAAVANQPGAQAQGAAPAKDTKQDAANTKGAPVTEADNMAADAIMYEIPMPDGSKRKMSPEAIASTISRYGDLNFRHSHLRPIVDVVEGYLTKNPNLTPRQLAERLSSLANSEVEFGGEGGRARTTGNPPGSGGSVRESAPAGDEAFRKWEEDNGVALPPGFREMSAGQSKIEQMLVQTQQMLQQVLAGSAGVADAARESVSGANNQRQQLIKARIGQNLDAVQQHLGLPDEAANDFMVFAAERGYGLEDFIDPELTFKVMSDFKANKDGPEMQRMRDIHTRRQSYTGSLTPMPGAGGEQPPVGGDSTFNRLAESVMARRMPQG